MKVSFSDEAFQREFGSYLCSVKPGLPATESRPGTCSVCGGTVSPGYTYCRPCDGVRTAVTKAGIAFPIDHAAFLTYAVEGVDLISRVQTGQVRESNERQGRQAYAVLKGYKTPYAQPYWTTIAVWTAWFLQRWGPWGPDSDGQDWLWATVPSVRSGRTGEHPLHAIVNAVLGADREVPLNFWGGSTERRFNPELFSCDQSLRGRSVLLVDDSWTSGGNILSAGAVLRGAGAPTVAAMVLGRLLNPGAWQPARDFIDNGGLRLDLGDGLQPGFDPTRSPWVKIDTVSI